ncbi:MAG: hypothetical protein MUQ10_07610 [Anaerolineae bacterium]|nr:hypothetical protein [Anaerolineae bacterium]
MHFTNGARSILTVSEVSTGQENNLSIRIWGTGGALEWHQEQPNYLAYTPADGPVQVMSRGSGYLCEAAQRATRLPTGHPEACIEAFGNIHVNATDTMHAQLMGVEPTDLELDFPTVYDGARGYSSLRRLSRVVGVMQNGCRLDGSGPK